MQWQNTILIGVKKICQTHISKNINKKSEKKIERNTFKVFRKY